jgi:hypothetical protein
LGRDVRPHFDHAVRVVAGVAAGRSWAASRRTIDLGPGGGVALIWAEQVPAFTLRAMTLFGWFWSFINVALTPCAFGALLILTCLPVRIPVRFLTRAAGLVAAVVLVAGTGYAIEFVSRFDFDEEEWFLISNISAQVSLALLILAALGGLRMQVVFPVAAMVCVATSAYSIRLMTSGDIDFDPIVLIYIILNGLVMPALAVMCAAITEGECDGRETQPWDPVSASVAP